MRFLISLLIIVVFFAVPFAHASGFKRVSVKLEQLHCKKCGETIKTAVDKEAPVKSVYVNVKERIVMFTFAEDTVPSEQSIKSAVESMGYKIVYIK